MHVVYVGIRRIHFLANLILKTITVSRREYRKDLLTNRKMDILLL